MLILVWQREAHLFLDAAFTGDAESAMEAMRQKYLRQGYDEAWIKQRQITIETRNQLTDEWKNRGVRGGTIWHLNGRYSSWCLRDDTIKTSRVQGCRKR